MGQPHVFVRIIHLLFFFKKNWIEENELQVSKHVHDCDLRLANDVHICCMCAKDTLPNISHLHKHYNHKKVGSPNTLTSSKNPSSCKGTLKRDKCRSAEFFFTALAMHSAPWGPMLFPEKWRTKSEKQRETSKTAFGNKKRFVK